jgi:hypothetical protein
LSETNAGEELQRLAELARRARGEVGDGAQRLQRAHFMARVDAMLEAEARPPRRAFRWAPAFAAAAAALLLLAFGLSRRSLSFEVQGAPRDGGYVRATNDQPATVTFSDRTTVLAAPGSRLRVEETNDRGARVLVERGRVDAEVVHRSSTAWTFVAGPFEVAVTGTRFSLEWEPERETLELTLLEGSVLVRGATGSGPWAVRAGQRFHGDVQHASMIVVESASAPTTSATTGAVTAPAVTAPAATASSDPSAPSDAAPAAPVHSAASRSEGWDARIARGEFAEIVKDAEARGTATCLGSCSAGDLRALSDAARYTGNGELAEQCLLALRKRFGSGQGRDAAFLLGRLNEPRGASALTWYDTYLREAPGGAFAAEALAGKMRVVRRLSGARAAAPIAREYLQRFPKGVSANTAREILAAE